MIDSFTQAADPAMAAQLGHTPSPLYVTWDPQTQQWAGGSGGLTAPLSCWQHLSDLVPVGLAWTNHAAAAVATWPLIPRAGADLLARLGTPPRAIVYTADPRQLWCGQTPAKAGWPLRPMTAR